MTTDRWSKWVLLEGAWHRPDPDHEHVTLCRISVPGGVAFVSSKQALAEIAVNRTTVCGRCERLAEQARRATLPPESAEDARSADSPPPHSQAQNLTAEQRALKEWLDRERARRTRIRKLNEADRGQPDKSQSIHTVSGGLPTLGKRR